MPRWTALIAVLALGIPAFDVAASDAAAAVSVWIEEKGSPPLHGKWLAADSPVAGALLVHQCDRDRSSPLTGYEALAERLATAGVSSLAIDLRGYGRSPATGPVRHEDAIAAGLEDLIRRMPAQSRIALVGASCGGREGLRVANRDLRIAAVVLLSSRLPTDLLPREGLPTLAFLGTSDPYGGSVASIQRVIERSRHESSRVETFETALHGTPLFGHDPELVGRITRWLREVLDSD